MEVVMRLRHCLYMFFIMVCLPVFSQARAVPDSFADLVEDLMPSVVNISTTQTVKYAQGGQHFEFFGNPQLPEGSPFNDLPELFERFYGHRGPNGSNGAPKSERKAVSLGSGFIIDKAGYIVTNNHVIDQADEITVVFSDDSKADATIVGRDPKTDIALLKVNVGHDLPAVKWGDSDEVRVGDWVIAIGNPFGLGGSVSAGIISARARDINAGPFDDFLQTDAAINRGNSGGPLFDVDGKVIGINTAIFSPSGGNVGIGFSVPIEMAKPVIKQLKETGSVKRGWLGVRIQNVTEEIAESIGMKKPRGALVLEVTKGSPAEDAGMLPSDIIISFDGKEVPVMRKLPRIVADTKVNKTVDVVVIRAGKEKTLKVTVAQLEDDSQEEEEVTTVVPSQEDNKDKYGEIYSVAGLEVADLSRDNRKMFKIKGDVEGVIIVGIKPESSADEKGLRVGDVIEAINQESVDDINDFKNVVEAAQAAARKSILLLVNRRGETQFIVVAL